MCKKHTVTQPPLGMVLPCQAGVFVLRRKRCDSPIRGNVYYNKVGRGDSPVRGISPTPTNGRARKPAYNGAPSRRPLRANCYLCVGTVLPVPFTPPQTPFAFRYAYFPNPSIRLYRLGNIQKTAIAVLWGFVLQQFQKLRTNFSADNKFFNDKTLPHGFGEIRGVH